MQVRYALGTNEWTRLGSETFMPLRIRTENEPVRGTLASMALSNIRIAQIQCTAATVSRTSALIASDGCDDILLNLQLSGSGAVIQEDRRGVLAGGEATLCEANRPYELRYEQPLSVLTLQVPRSRLAPYGTSIRDANARVLPAHSPGLIVLRHYLFGLLRSGGDAAANEQVFAETTVTLLAASLGLSAGSRPSNHSRLTQIRAFIDRNYPNPDLTIEEIAHAHRVSRRYLENLFSEQEDSPSAYLRRLRLQRASALLRQSGPAQTIMHVAHAVGFQDSSTFIRAFRREYDCTPGEWRRGNIHP